MASIRFEAHISFQCQFTKFPWQYVTILNFIDTFSACFSMLIQKPSLTSWVRFFMSDHVHVSYDKSSGIKDSSIEGKFSFEYAVLIIVLSVLYFSLVPRLHTSAVLIPFKMFHPHPNLHIKREDSINQ